VQKNMEEKTTTGHTQFALVQQGLGVGSAKKEGTMTRAEKGWENQFTSV